MHAGGSEQNLIISAEFPIVALNRCGRPGTYYHGPPLGGRSDAFARTEWFFMLILRYFVFVGGALLALLLVCDAVLPQVPLPTTLQSSPDIPLVRIRSERRWPERIVLDTSIPAISSVTIATADTAQPKASVADVPAQPKLREAFAQMASVGRKLQQPAAQAARTAEPAVVKSAEVKAQPRRKVAKLRSLRPLVLVAQQPQLHSGWFESTW